MGDRELLELAAKAAGMNVLVVPWPNESGWFFCVQHERPALHYRDLTSRYPTHAVWAPLTDDGDALRLAVKLRMRVHATDYGTSARIGEGDWHGCESHLYGGIEAATRRAIVRAAAELARSTPTT